VRDVVVWSEELITPPARKIYIVAEVIWILREEGGGGLGLKREGGEKKRDSSINVQFSKKIFLYSLVNMCTFTNSMITKSIISMPSNSNFL
jgi:hypothetical protein